MFKENRLKGKGAGSRFTEKQTTNMALTLKKVKERGTLRIGKIAD